MAAASRQPDATAGRLVQSAPDFFMHEPDLPVDAKKSLDLLQKVPFVQVDHAHTAMKIVANPDGSAPAVFRHPRATHEILLAGQLVAYEVKRRKRRSIGFSVGREGLAVSAPKWVPLAEIYQAVVRKSGWIVKKLHETRERHFHEAAQQTLWRDGAVFYFLGEPVRLVLEGHQLHSALHGESAGDGAGRVLRVKLPFDATPDQIQASVQTWLMQQAMPIFTARLDFFAPQLGVQWRKLSLSSALTRWGSASSSGAIRLNWRLMYLHMALIDYVVVHELSHLHFMDHSPRFWATVQGVMPGYAVLRQQLRNQVLLQR